MKVCASFWSYPLILASQRESAKNNKVYKFSEKDKYKSNTIGYENPIELSKKTQYFFDLYEKSFNSFKTLYSDASIITDEFGAFLFKKYTNICPSQIKISIDEKINKYHTLWNLGKIFTYEMISRIGDPVLFFDLDVILYKELPEDFIKNDIFCYDDICKNNVLDWEIEIFINHIKNNKTVCNNNNYLNKMYFLKKALTIQGQVTESKNINQEEISTPIPNCAILGGSNPQIIYEIYSEILKNIYCQENFSYWSKQTKETFQKPCVAEQLVLGLCCMEYKQKYKHIISNYNYDPECTIMNFLNHYPDKRNVKIKHLGWHKQFLGEKKIDEVLDNIEYWK